MEPKQQDLAEFERNRNQLLSISSQKQQLQFQASALKNALDELEKTSEKKKALKHRIVFHDEGQ